MADRSVRVVLSGRVQGVGMRWQCITHAEALGLNGWVTNRPDGRVELQVEGPEPDVSGFLDWLSGSPGYSLVEDMQVSDVPPEGHQGFGVR